MSRANSNDIDIDEDDFKLIESTKGERIYYESNVFSVDDLEKEIYCKFINCFFNAKAILIKFYINQNQKLDAIIKFTELITSKIDALVVFGTEFKDDIKIGGCRIDLLIKYESSR